MSISYLLQATRILHKGNYDESELKMVFEFIISLDYEILNSYYLTNSIISYSNDLELYTEICEALIKIFEEREEYEKCDLILDHIHLAKDISENKFN
jgi:hypothetical protein